MGPSPVVDARTGCILGPCPTRPSGLLLTKDSSTVSGLNLQHGTNPVLQGSSRSHHSDAAA